MLTPIAFVLLAIYIIVTAVLLILLRFSACARERLYFAFCAASAAFGMVRIILGDPVLHANVLRVLLLFCAALGWAAWGTIDIVAAATGITVAW